MDVAAVVISVVALLMAAILAGYGILVQWFVSRDTQRYLGDFRSEASQLLGEIRGLTTVTRETQERQFETVLQAAVRRTTEATTTETDGILERIDAVETALAEERQPSEQVAGEIRQLREMVDALKHDIPRAVQQVEPQPEGEPQPRIPTLRVTPQPQSVDARVEIEAFWTVPNLPKTWRSRLGCIVTTPAGDQFSASESVGPGIYGFGRPTRFVYPDSFAGANADLPGRYDVVAEVLCMGAWRDVASPPARTSFDLAKAPDGTKGDPPIR